MQNRSRVEEMLRRNKWTRLLFEYGIFVLDFVIMWTCFGTFGEAQMVAHPDLTQHNSNYVSSRSPLHPVSFIKLPVGSIQPKGWIGQYLLLQRDGLTGHLDEISAWLARDHNA